MLKCKTFFSDNPKFIEQSVNSFLENNPQLAPQQIIQSQSGDQDGYHYWTNYTITIFYNE
jgi:hypothetical protein